MEILNECVTQIVQTHQQRPFLKSQAFYELLKLTSSDQELQIGTSKISEEWTEEVKRQISLIIDIIVFDYQ